jgi:hypothetical protein
MGLFGCISALLLLSGLTSPAEANTISIPLSFVSIPGFANDVAVSGNFAYVAAGGSGFQVVNVSDRLHPVIVASLTLPGNANDVVISGNLAYVAGGAAGLHVVNIANPLAPILTGTLNSIGTALGVEVRDANAYIVNGSQLIIANVSNPASPVQVGALSLTGIVQSVDVDSTRHLAVVARGSAGVEIIDISNPAAPVLLGTVATGDARAVTLSGNYAIVADFNNSTTSVDITNPNNPIVLSHILNPSQGGHLLDTTIMGNLAFGADVLFVNSVPITDITDPANLLSDGLLTFPQRDDNGMGIASDNGYVYLVTEHASLSKFGSIGDSRLYIGSVEGTTTQAPEPSSLVLLCLSVLMLLVTRSLLRQ